MKHFLKEPWVRWEKWQMHKCKLRKKKAPWTFKGEDDFQGNGNVSRTEWYLC